MLPPPSIGSFVSAAMNYPGILRGCDDEKGNTIGTLTFCRSLLKASLVESASSSCFTSGPNASSAPNQCSFQPPRNTSTLPACACAENGLNRVTLSPPTLLNLTSKPA